MEKSNRPYSQSKSALSEEELMPIRDTATEDALAFYEMDARNARKESLANARTLMTWLQKMNCLIDKETLTEKK